MKVLLFNGSPRAKGCTYTALCEIEKVLHAEGIETELVQVGTQPVAGCIACGKCKDGSPCIFDDQVNALAKRLDEFDGIIVGAPIYYAGPSAQSTAFLDRLFYCAAAKLKGKPAAAIVSCRRGGAGATFDALNKYFTISEMPVASSSYWNQIHGTKPGEIAGDEEGIITMRRLARNIVFLMRSIELGKKEYGLPEKEKGKATNFIR